MRTPEEIASESIARFRGQWQDAGDWHRAKDSCIRAASAAQSELAQKVAKLLAQEREHDPAGSTMDSVRGAKAMERKFHAAVTELDALLAELTKEGQ